MAKFLESVNRLQNDIFVCMRCKRKRRINIMKILAGKVSCRSCGYDKLRPMRKK